MEHERPSPLLQEHTADPCVPILTHITPLHIATQFLEDSSDILPNAHAPISPYLHSKVSRP
jgi:hypothetical protein